MSQSLFQLLKIYLYSWKKGYSCSYQDGLKVSFVLKILNRSLSFLKIWAGRLYLFQSHICFYSNLFFSEKKIVLPHLEICKIVDNSNKFIHSIDITTLDEKCYSFISFIYREDAFKLLQSSWLKSLDKSIQARRYCIPSVHVYKNCTQKLLTFISFFFRSVDFGEPKKGTLSKELLEKLRTPFELKVDPLPPKVKKRVKSYWEEGREMSVFSASKDDSILWSQSDLAIKLFDEGSSFTSLNSTLTSSPQRNKIQIISPRNIQLKRKGKKKALPSTSSSLPPVTTHFSPNSSQKIEELVQRTDSLLENDLEEGGEKSVQGSFFGLSKVDRPEKK